MAASLPDRLHLVGAAAAIASGMVAVLVAALVIGGAQAPPVAGLPDAGPVTAWGLPLAQLATQAAAVVTVGCLLMAAFLLPSYNGRPCADGARYACAAVGAAGVWALAAAASVVFSFSDILAVSVDQMWQVRSVLTLVGYAWSIPQGRVLAVTVGAAVLAAGLARTSRTVGGLVWALALATLAVLAPVFTGHSAASENHEVAVSALAVHVLAALAWTGGLGALVTYAVVGGRHLRSATERFSRLAGICLLAVGASGVFNLLACSRDLAALAAGGYGLLVIGKIVLFAGAGAAGFWHRHRTLAELRAGRPRAFARLAVGEVCLLAAAIALAVALSRTPPPASPPEPADTVTGLLGFPLSPPLALDRLLSW